MTINRILQEAVAHRLWRTCRSPMEIRNFSIMERYRQATKQTQDSTHQTPNSSNANEAQHSDPPLHKKKSYSSRPPIAAYPYFGYPNLTRGKIPSEVQFPVWMPPEQPENPHVLSVAIVGPPNAGKSSLLNLLTGANISAVSPKVNTTRTGLNGIVTEKNYQIQFLDAPGVVASHGNKAFSNDLLAAAWRGYEEADLCVFVTDCLKRPVQQIFEVIRAIAPKEVATKDLNGLPLNPMDSATATFRDRGKIIGISSAVHANRLSIIGRTKQSSGATGKDAENAVNPPILPPVCLVLNKIDKVTHPKWINSRIQEFTAQGEFDEVFCMSAKYGTGHNKLMSYLFDKCHPGAWLHPPEMKTAMSKIQQLEQVVRTYLFCWFNKDVPYKINQNTVGWTEGYDNSIIIEHELLVDSAKVAKMICGVRNRLLWQLRKNAMFRLQQLWQRPVLLYIHVKVV